MADLRLIYGFHAITARIRQNPDGVLEVYLQAQRKDPRMRDLIKLAETSGVRVIPIEAARLDGMAGSARHQGVAARVVSMPSWEIFDRQPEEYRNQVLPPRVLARVSIEAGSTFGWRRYVGVRGDTIGIDHFGASAPGGLLMEKYGFTVDNVVKRALEVMKKQEHARA